MESINMTEIRNEFLALAKRVAELGKRIGVIDLVGYTCHGGEHCHGGTSNQLDKILDAELARTARQRE